MCQVINIPVNTSRVRRQCFTVDTKYTSLGRVLEEFMSDSYVIRCFVAVYFQNDLRPFLDRKKNILKKKKRRRRRRKKKEKKRKKHFNFKIYEP